MQSSQFDDSFTAWRVFADRPLAEAQVRVIVDREAHNSKPLSGEAAAAAEELWAARLAANPRLFNATKFRLGDVTATAEAGCTFSLGLTDYRTYLTTNLAAPELDFEQAVRADPVGNSGLVVTADGLVPLHRRSQHTSEFQAWWDFPGGHAEPSNASIAATQDAGDSATSEGERARAELFQSVANEMNEELGLPHASMLAPRLAGVVRHHASRGKPVMLFVVKTSLTAKEVADHFYAAQDAEESTSLVFFAVDVLKAGKGPVALVARPPAHAGGDAEGDAEDDADAEGLDAPTRFEDIAATLVPSAGFGIDLIRNHGLADRLLEDWSAKHKDAPCCIL